LINFIIMSERSDKIQAIFKKYDSNNNGTICKDEFSTFFTNVLNEMGVVLTSEQNTEAINEGLQIFDKNNDGTLQFDEFVEMINRLGEIHGYQI